MKTTAKISKSFISFLIASIFIWTLINLSKEYSTELTYNISYEAIPQDKLLQEDPLKEMKLLVEGTGFKLLVANFSHRAIRLKADRLQQKSNIQYCFSPKDQQLYLQKQLHSGLRLTQVLQDTIYLKLGSLARKKVPVVPNVTLKYIPGFDLSEPIQVKPDSVLVTGPELQLNKLQDVSTGLISLEEIDSDFSNKIDVVLPKELSKLKLAVREVVVSGKVDKYTEGELEVPFEVENVPFGIELNVFPKTVKVTYKVGLKDFGKVEKTSFKISCDYNYVLENKASYMIPKLIQKPNFVRSVKIMPNSIEFLVHK